MATRFLSTARALLKKCSALAFDQSGDAGKPESLVSAALQTAYEKGLKEGQSLKSKSKPPRNPEGGWLPPVIKELHAFWKECDDEATRRFGVDEDGDACVTVRLIDHSRQEYTHFEPVPREIEDSPYHPYGNNKWGVNGMVPKKHTPEEEESRRHAILENRAWIKRIVGLNFKMAADRMNRLMDEDERELRKEMERPEKERAARIKTLEELKKKWADPFKYYEDQGYIVDRVARTRTYTSKFREPARTTVTPIGEPPANFDQLMEELKRLKNYKPAPIQEL